MTNRIGVLGRGQLAQMLAEAASGLDCLFLEYAGDLRDLTGLRSFFEGVDSVIFENEFVDTAQLAEVARGRELDFYPRLEVIREFQDKLLQKRRLSRLSIDTPRWVEGVSAENASRIVEDFGTGGCVFKWSRLGYDGKGVWIVSDPESWRQRDRGRTDRFFAEAEKLGVAVFAEERVAFTRELAIVACRTAKGEFVSFPLVISEQENGICRSVQGPAISLGVDSALGVQAAEWARRLAEDAGLVGCFALEFFETSGGKLQVNEIAPRVHNSGHYTQDAYGASQFEAHLRAVLGQAIRLEPRAPFFAMVNLLGPAGGRGSFPPPSLPKGKGWALHWYGKDEMRPRRKMGHVNLLAGSFQELRVSLQELNAFILKLEQEWKRGLRP